MGSPVQGNGITRPAQPVHPLRFQDLLPDTGVLWVINTIVFQPRGLVLCELLDVTVPWEMTVDTGGG
jgi:hypothetical protein